MKKFIYIVATAITLGSCGLDKDYYCYKGEIRVLNKEYYAPIKGNPSYRFYLYDGKEAFWYNTNNKTYNSFQINDTLPTIVIKVIEHKK